MGLVREEKIFVDFCRRFGGMCRLLRRGFIDDGGRQIESMNAVGESVCLLTGFEGTLPEIEPAALDKSRARIYLPGGVDIRMGDSVEVHWHEKDIPFSVCGLPQDYGAYIAADIRKEEWV